MESHLNDVIQNNPENHKGLILCWISENYGEKDLSL